MSKTTQIFNSLANKRTGRALRNLFGSNAPENIKKLFNVSNAQMASASGPGLSPAIWDSCPRGQMLIDPTSGHFVGDDFTYTTKKSYLNNQFYYVTGTNKDFTPVAEDPNGIALLTSTGADNDECNVNYAGLPGIIKLDNTKDWWFESRVKINQATLAQGVFVGLISDDTAMAVDFMSDDDMVIKDTSLIGFQILSANDDAASWRSVFRELGSAIVADTTALATTSWVKLGMKSNQGNVSYFIDGNLMGLAEYQSSTYPKDVCVVPAFATKCGQASENTLSVDWWYAAQTR